MSAEQLTQVSKKVGEKVEDGILLRTQALVCPTCEFRFSARNALRFSHIRTPQSASEKEE
ncbi:MAG: hypothetical protein AAF483_26760 [Planctomycetota bacterium]